MNEWRDTGVNGGVVWRRRVEWNVARRRGQIGAVVYIVVYCGSLIIMKTTHQSFHPGLADQLGTGHPPRGK